MLLIHMVERIGPGGGRPDAAPPLKIVERHVAFASRLSLAEALSLIGAYRAAYNRRFYVTVAVTFRLLSVATIDDLDDETLGRFYVSLVERLAVE
jgi:hypothetical protein